jgi:NarL family two-component system response regulator LiaR
MPETEMARLALTKREQQIVARVARGRTNREISRELNIGEQTVKNHLSGIFEKLQVRNRLELALLAVARGLDKGVDDKGADG